MKIIVIGSGYVGLVTAACFSEVGLDVWCMDMDAAKIARLNAGGCPIYEPALPELLTRNAAAGRLHFTTSLEDCLEDADVAFIAVGTPEGEDGSADLSYVCNAARSVGQLMKGDLVVVVKSTVPVGTCARVEAILREELDARRADFAFDVVSNPEFLKEGHAVNDFMMPDRVIIGVESDRARAIMSELYRPFMMTGDRILFMDRASSELTKYTANAMLATRISFMNDIANLCERVGASVDMVRKGIGMDHRIGPKFLYAGCGYGGSCFPKDVKALIHTAEAAGMEPKLLNAVEAVNARQKLHMAERIKEYFAPQGGVKGKTLALWGLAFKANTDDMREAASINIINALTEAGMKVRAFDPVAADNARRIFQDNPLVEIVDDQYGVCDGAQALLVVTEWNQFRNPDFDRIKSLLTAPLLFDGRNLYSPAAMGSRGFAYFCIGRRAD